MARKAGTTSQDTEAQIYSAARNLFARFGYAAVSMRQIAGDVGVNQAALYHYTPTKQDLLAGLLTRHMSALLEAIAAEDFQETLFMRWIISPAFISVITFPAQRKSSSAIWNCARSIANILPRLMR